MVIPQKVILEQRDRELWNELVCNASNYNYVTTDVTTGIKLLLRTLFGIDPFDISFAAVF